MFLLTLRDLQHRFSRFAVVTLMGAIVFSLLFVMTGVAEQFHREPADTVAAFGATTWVLPEGVPGPFTATAAMPTSLAQQVGGEGASPAVITRGSITASGSTREIILVGHVPGALGTPPVDDGRAVAAAGEVVVDNTVKARVGDGVLVAGIPFQVVGRTDSTTMFAGIPLVFMGLDDAQQLAFQSSDVVSLVLVGGEASAPPGTRAFTATEIVDDSGRPLERPVATINLVRYLLWLVAAMSIGAVVYLSALERLRDFAVLKAMGTPNRSLMSGLAIQAVLIALGASALAMVAQIFLADLFPLKVVVPGRAFWQIPLAAVVVSLLASLAGLRKVGRSEPALAFSGAGG